MLLPFETVSHIAPHNGSHLFCSLLPDSGKLVQDWQCFSLSSLGFLYLARISVLESSESNEYCCERHSQLCKNKNMEETGKCRNFNQLKQYNIKGKAI